MNGDSTAPTDSQPEYAAATAIENDPATLQDVVPTEAPDSRTPEQVTEQPGDAPGTTVGASQEGRRSLKLVVTLTPIDTAGYHGLLAVGTNDCDPLLRSVEVADLSTALQEAASLVVAAEERWQSQPRNPSSVKKGGGASAKRSSARQQSPNEGSHYPGDDAPESEPAQPGQLPLFG